MALFAGTLVAAIIFGMLRGGHISRLTSLPIKYEGLALVALLLRGLLFMAGERGKLLEPTVVMTVQGLSYGLLLWFVWLNRNVAGMWLLGGGFAANALVILANGGRMPVSQEAAVSSGLAGSYALLGEDVSYLHQALSASTRLPFLGDVLALPSWLPVGVAFSIGDVLILAGVFILVYRTMFMPAPVRPMDTPGGSFH